MNNKLYALLLTLTLPATPAIQAMRLRTPMVMTARSLRPGMPTHKNLLARTYSAHNKDHGYSQDHGYGHEESYDIYNDYLRMAVNIGIGVAAQKMTEKETKEPTDIQQDAKLYLYQDGSDALTNLYETALQEEEAQEQVPVAIDTLDISDVPAVLEALEHATETDKRLVAQKVAEELKRYTLQTFIQMLQLTTGRPHRTLVNAVTKNITHFTIQQITQILKADTQRDTHEQIAWFLSKNYAHFTGITFAGYQLYTHKEWRTEFVNLLGSLNKEYQSVLLRPILKNIQEHNVLHLLRITDGQNKEAILAAFNQATHINLCAYADRELVPLLELSRAQNQTNVARAIAQNINAYNGWHFYGMFKQPDDLSTQIIITAIADHIQENICNYDFSTLQDILAACNENNRKTITTEILNVNSFPGRCDLDSAFLVNKKS